MPASMAPDLSAKITSPPALAELKIDDSWASPKSSNKTPKRASPKLPLKQSRKGDSWTIPASSKAYFRVRLADTGYRVNLRFQDDEGTDRERYLCYLTLKEWNTAKRNTLDDFTALIVGKIEARRASPDKIESLIAQVKAM